MSIAAKVIQIAFKYCEFRSLNIGYLDLDKRDIITPVVEAHCNYYHPARYDDVIAVETGISEIKEKSIRLS